MKNLQCLILFLAIILISINGQNVIRSTLEFLRRGQEELLLENMDNQPMKPEYDFIIVGAGTAGCAVAARLSENPKWNILLIEAGQHESLIMDVPIFVHFLQLGTINWKYRTQPSKKACLAMNNNRCNLPRGKVMGGSSVLNYMMYTRGNRKDYDNWAALGNVGWSYADVLPYFKKLEDSSVPDAEPEYVGKGGPVTVSYVNWRSDIAKAFVAAAQEGGLKYIDYNGRSQIGVSHLHTTTRNLSRTSSNRAYLYPIKGRKNLHIQKLSMVTKVLINPKTKTAYGVVLHSGGRYYKIKAKKEVILSAGAINTPQLLMLSGVGPADHLKEKGITPILDLPVGFNLMDHTAPAVTFTTNASSIHFDLFADPLILNDFMRNSGPYGSPGGCESIAFYDLDHPEKPEWPDMELILIGGSMAANPAISRAFGLKPSIYNSLYAEMEEKNLDAFIILPMVLHPKSKGRVMLKTNDPFKYPLIYSNYMDHPYDVDISVRGILKSLDLINTKAFKAINAKLWDNIIPGCAKYGYATYEYWQCYVRYMTFTIYHYSGTCRMGPDNDTTAVVDPRLKVHGIKNLRVIDASIMPEIISGHPNGPVFMIAEKGAEMIKQDYGFINP